MTDYIAGGGAVSIDAQQTLEHFTKAPDGRAVMDGDGVIWRYSAADDLWYARRHPASPVDSRRLAFALAPGLEEALGVES